jgi:hypothetical protein
VVFVVWLHAPRTRTHPVTNLQAIVQLNVGGTPYATTVATLTSVPGSVFWDLLTPGSSGLPEPPRTAMGELFLDRNGKVCVDFRHMAD